jgi:hypothetical protein
MLTLTPPATQTKSVSAITTTPPPPYSSKTRRLSRQMMSWCLSTTTSWTHIHPLTYVAMCLLNFFAEPLTSPWPMAGYEGCKPTDNTSCMLRQPSAFPLSVMPIMALATRAFIPHAAPSLTAFGGHCLIAMSNGMLRLAINANSTRPHKSEFCPPLPPPHHFFARSMLHSKQGARWSDIDVTKSLKAGTRGIGLCREQRSFCTMGTTLGQVHT